MAPRIHTDLRDSSVCTRVGNIGVFPKCFHWIQWQQICHYSKRARTYHSATFCARDQDANTAPARHMWETRSLNQAQFMLQWLSVSLNSLNSVKVLLHLGKTPLCRLGLKNVIPSGNRTRASYIFWFQIQHYPFWANLASATSMQFNCLCTTWFLDLDV